jgi:hypothetical protein
MESVQLHSHPLPPEPTTYEMWRTDRPQLLGAYHLAYNAERYAIQQALSDSSKKAKDRILFARVFGYLLVELFNWRAILTEGPCNRLLIELQSGDGDDNNTVFNIGKLYCDYFLRSCAFYFLHMSFDFSISRSLDDSHELPRTPIASFLPFLRHDGRNGRAHRW